MKTAFFTGMIAALGFLCVVLWGPPRLIPRALLFGNPERVQPQISPDGKTLAYLAPYEGVLNLWVRSPEGDDRAVTREKGRGILNFFWARDSRQLMFLRDQNGDENTHLYRVELQSGALTDLTPYAGVKVQVLASEKNHPDFLLIGMNQKDPRFFDAYRLNWKTGALELAAENDGAVSQWISDAKLHVRGALIAGKDGNYALKVRDSEAAAWRVAAEWGFEDNMALQPIGFSDDGLSFYLVDSRDFSAGRLVKLDLASGEKEILAENPRRDVFGVMMHPDRRRPQAVFWLGAYKESVVLDDAIAGDMRRLEKRHGKNFAITSRDDADQKWIIRAESDRAPVAYFLYDRQTAKSEFLFEHQPGLKRYRLARMRPFTTLSRDGLELNGYITFPPGRLPRNLPMVLKVHGGPWTRDVWGYDARAQWLANRGYLCLQVNFRGSTSYGKAFLNAGNKEWGGKMQDDLADAVGWAVKQGYADPKRIAIFGGSYGGYAALAGAAFTPDLFKAAIAVVGPSNLLTFIRTTPAYWVTELENVYRRVGHPENDAALLQSKSPLFFADRIKTPLLIAQGANDPRVKKAESDQIVAALKKHGIEHEYLLFEDEGHGFARPENQLLFFKKAEMFLARHLGGAVEN